MIEGIDTEGSVPKGYARSDITALGMINRWLNDEDEDYNGNRTPRTQADLAKASGINPSTFNTILKGAYGRDPSKFLIPVLDYIERKREREMTAVNIPMVETSIYKMARMTFRRAHRNRDIGVLAGEMGIGKTYAAKHYVSVTPRATLIEGLPKMTDTALINRLMVQLKIKVDTGSKMSRGSKDQKTFAIIDHLKDRDALLILDEADKMSSDALECARRISDLSECGCVFVGTKDLEPMLKSKQGKHGQISSRNGFHLQAITFITQQDAVQILEAVFVPQKINLSTKVLDAYWRLCDGRARVLVKLIRNVIESGLTRKKDHTAALIYTVGRDLMGLDIPKGVKL